MYKQRWYYNTRFPSQVVKEAHDLFISSSGIGDEKSSPGTLMVVVNGEEWRFDTREEFLAEYPKASDFHFQHHIYIYKEDKHCHFCIESGKENKENTSVQIGCPARPQIESVFQIFERNLSASIIVVESKPLTVFIGHGHDPQWRDLKDHLHEQHRLKVIAYEIGPRAGLSVKEVLEKMLTDSSIAFLVLTGEDMHVDGELHARENVIHELGLFQGKVGFKRAIAILEEGVNEFSNILGVNQIRFSKSNIREAYGDVLATIRREFGRQE